MIDNTSRLPNFYNLSLSERKLVIGQLQHLTSEDINALFADPGLENHLADSMIENVIGTHSLPLGLALNFIVNGKEVLIPMSIEEPSVVAGASFMAKLARDSGGFRAQCTPPEMIGQIQLLDVQNLNVATKEIISRKTEILEKANEADPILNSLGGGARDLRVRKVEESPIGPFLVLHLIYDVRDAMGANAINTACEHIAPYIESLTGGRVHLRILSNLADRRLTRATCSIPAEKLAFKHYSGEEVRDRIVEAWAFAQADPYRATTHNKGIMNGVDAVVIATGNDWRAVEAGAHAFAARDGQYRSLSIWSVDEDGNLVGELEMPMAVGIVGGATKVHPTAKAALKLMQIKTATQLAEIIVSVGLAQNLAAMRALATEGIQKGHMSLHARQVAIAAGASGPEIERLATALINENLVRIDRAEEILSEWSIDD